MRFLCSLVYITELEFTARLTHLSHLVSYRMQNRQFKMSFWSMKYSYQLVGAQNVY